VRDLSTLLGVAVAVIPSAPLLFVYVPARVRWWRDRRAVAAALRSRPGGRGLDVLLARRALSTVPYERVLGVEISDELDDRDVDRLAAAELRRLRLSPRSQGSISPRRMA
jgi:hypothetical protein